MGVENDVAENQRVAQILGNSMFSDEDFVRQLLQKNIYGVDLNEESVEITKLSLWLKSATKGKHLTALDDNIKCGNSLITNPEVAGPRAFDWSIEFPEVVARGGFDIVLGNPPWIFARGGNFSEVEKAHYYTYYRLANYQLNTYLLFIELSHRLTKLERRVGVIVPNTCLTIDSFTTYRKFLVESVGDLEVTNIFGAVFEDAAVDSCIITFRKGASTTITLSEINNNERIQVGTFPLATFATDSHIINISMMKNLARHRLNEVIETKSDPLSPTHARVSTGVKVYQVGKGNPPQTEAIKKGRAFHSRTAKDDTHLRYLEGRDVRRYVLDWSGEFVSYGDWIAEPRRSVAFDVPRILVRQIPSKPPHCINAAYVDEKFINDIDSMVIQEFNSDPLFLLGVLNSRLSSFWFINKFDKLQRGTFPQFKVKELALFPIPKATPEQQSQVERLVTEMQSAQQQFKEMKEEFKLLATRSFGSATWPKSCTAWWELDKSAFLTALPQSLPMASAEELLDLFTRRQPKLIGVNESISRLDAQLDALVEYLIGLSAEESKLIHS